MYLPLAPLLLSLALGWSFPTGNLHPNTVENLPGAPDLNFPMYSGFLDASNEGISNKIFYVLCESIRVDPSTAPLIVWFNGGPGASSLFGMMMEHGPYMFDGKGTLHANNYSWNQFANVLYLESPQGVGFSYDNQSGINYIDDDIVAELNYLALRDFQTKVHPNYENRDFYLSGESYAGVYIPFLTRRILRSHPSAPNFKGVAEGNAHVDQISGKLAARIQMYAAGLLPQKFGPELFDAWKHLLNEDSKGVVRAFLSDEIRKAENERLRQLGASTYDVSLHCPTSKNETVSVLCNYKMILHDYFNRNDVQDALHVLETRGSVKWEAVNRLLNLKYKRTEDTIPLYREILETASSGFRILFYTGDLDLMCPPLQVAFGARRIADQNGMKEDFEFDSWKYYGDLAGAWTRYQYSKKNIIMDVLTVRGAGHMVPQDLPEQSFQMINNFIKVDTLVDYSESISQ